MKKDDEGHHHHHHHHHHFLFLAQLWHCAFPSLFLFLLLLGGQLASISADLCSPPGLDASVASSPSAAAASSRLGKPAKQCPDFKDGPEQRACCPSQITTGAFFCCTPDQKSELEAKLAAEARRQFISDHLFELVLCLLGLLLFLFLFCSFLCRHTRYCPLLHRRKGGQGNGRPSGSLSSAGSICRPIAHQIQAPYHNHRPIRSFAAHSQHHSAASGFGRHHQQPFTRHNPVESHPHYSGALRKPLVGYEDYRLVPPPPPYSPPTTLLENITHPPSEPAEDRGGEVAGEGSEQRAPQGIEEEEQNRLNAQREGGSQ